MRSEAGPILAAGAVLIGARAGEDLPASGALGAVLGLVVLALSARKWPRVGGVGSAGRSARVLARRRAGGALHGLLLLAALGALMMARAVSGLDGMAARLVGGDAERKVAVRLAADPQGRWTGARVPARLEAVDGRRARGTVLVVASRGAAERILLLEAGESAVLLGHFRSLDAGEERWRWRHAGAVLEAHDLVGAGRAEPALLRAANGLRHRVLAGGEALGDTDRALVAGFLVGDDRGLPAAVVDDFRAAGLSHLLVVSGANVTLALAFVAPLFRRFGLLGRLAGGLTVLVVFAAMTRFEPSVLRAAGMSGLGLLAAFLGRPAAGMRLLALSVAGLVLVDPFLVHSLGFGLSCGASAGILLLSGPLARRLRGPRFLRESLAVTTAAQIGVAPIALPAFGQLPLVALPANLAAAPAAAALSLWGLASGLFGGLLNETTGPAALLQVPTAVLAGWIRTVARIAGASPFMIGLP